MPTVALFGAGSPLIVDVEESCARAGWPVATAVRNVPGPAYSSPDVHLTDADDDTRLDHPVLLPLFTPANRRKAWMDALARGARRFPALVDPTSILPRRISIAEGVYVNAGCVLGAESALGRFSLVNRGAKLGHHFRLGAFASIGPGVVIAGGVCIGDGAMVGAGAVILPNVQVGEGAVVGAGTVVRQDVPPGARFVGKAALGANPA